jgi:hypothetical protein
MLRGVFLQISTEKLLEWLSIRDVLGLIVLPIPIEFIFGQKKTR